MAHLFCGRHRGGRPLQGLLLSLRQRAQAEGGDQRRLRILLRCLLRPGRRTLLLSLPLPAAVPGPARGVGGRPELLLADAGERVLCSERAVLRTEGEACSEVFRFTDSEHLPFRSLY